MFEKIIQLKNHKFVAANAAEVLSVPAGKTVDENEEKAFETVKKTWNRLCFEIYKLSSANETAVELLFVSEGVENQTFKSKIHIFVILRRIGNDKAVLEKEVSSLQEDIVLTLSKINYSVKAVELTDSDFSALVSRVDCSSHYQIVKEERISGGSGMNGSLYYWDILKIDSKDDLSGILNEISKYDKCAVSFQLIPARLSEAQVNALNLLSGNYQQMANKNVTAGLADRDESTEAALNTLQYCIRHRESPLYFYSVSVFANSETVKHISAKLVSLLNSGENEISDCNLIALNFSPEKISLNKFFFLYPWMINSLLVNKYRMPALKNVSDRLNLTNMPYLMSLEEINVFFRLPLYSKAVPMLMQNKSAGEAEQFSQDVIGENTINIGTLISDDNRSIKIGCPLKSWTQHALVVGMPGTGKTTFSVNILTQFAKNGIPFLAIEPTKSEYRAMIDAVDGLQIFTPGNNAVSPFIINPFLPPKNITVEQYKPSLLNAFKAAFSMDGPLQMIFNDAINACYLEYGWKDNSKNGDADVKPFGMFEYVLCFKRVMQSMGYAGEVKSNIGTAGLLRLMNLIEQNSNIYDSIHTVPIEDLLSKPTVLELNAIDNDEQKALIMALLLSNICVYTKNNQAGDGKLKNIILVDEAHVLLDSGADSEDTGNSKSVTVKTIQKMIAEIRSYGTGIIIADQKASAVTDSIISDTNIKVSFRLTSVKERSLIAGSCDMSEENSEFISKLGVGQAFVYFDKLNSPQLVQTEDTRARDEIRLSVPNEEIVWRSNYWKGKTEMLIPFKECVCSSACKSCSFSIRNDSEYFASKLLNSCLPKIKDKKALFGYACKIPTVLKKHLSKYGDEEKEKIYNCTIIKFIRKAELNMPFSVTVNEIQKVIEASRKGS